MQPPFNTTDQEGPGREQRCMKKTEVSHRGHTPSKGQPYSPPAGCYHVEIRESRNLIFFPEISQFLDIGLLFV